MGPADQAESSNAFGPLIAEQVDDNDGDQAIPGVGPTFAAVFVAEIGDVSRFPGPVAQLCSWAGLTPHRESDTTVHRGAPLPKGAVQPTLLDLQPGLTAENYLNLLPHT